MSEPSEEATALSCRSLGLVANPFRPRPGSAAEDYIGAALSMHAAANGLIAAIDAAASGADSRPIWVEKAGLLPAYYYVGPLAEVLGTLGTGERGTNVLACYVPMEQMRLGRARAALSVVAERIAGVHVDRTIAAWARGVLAAPDTSLDEWDAVGSADVTGLLEALSQSPEETIERYFGPNVPEREGVDDLETLMRVSTARQEVLEVDPDEELGAEAPADVASEDEAPEGPLSEAFATPLGAVEDTDELLAVQAEPDDGLPRADALLDYLVAHARTHLSPVIARGLRAYRAQGTSSMAEELKISKAPTKTLAALCRLAATRFDKVVFLYDRFDSWNTAPEDLRVKIVGTLSQLRFALRDSTVFVIMAATDQVTEIEEQFGSATRIVWDMKGLERVEGMDPSFDIEVAQDWLNAAMLAEAGPMSLSEGPLSVLVASSDGSLNQTAALLAAAIDDAAERGLTRIDDMAVEAARSLAFTSD